ncbi:Uroporphyrinogen decarboxylase [Candidatus Calditenuaceae archaeon HR02]|nr:Uroporphyrinogen decarboxylase [Candidatus Calditenuaceae archaeon HR02]
MNDILLRACRLEDVERRPIWFMRQAGRYLPQYEEIRRGRNLEELFMDVESSAELTAIPVWELGVDAAIVFADLLTPLTGSGIRVVYYASGPYVPEAKDVGELVRRLRRFEPNSVHYVYETISLSRRYLSDSVPVIGFAGAPYTLAVYLVGGMEKDAGRVRALMRMGDVWGDLMDSISEMTRLYVENQVESGARAIALFDTLSFTLNAEQFERHVVRETRNLVSAIRRLGVPVIYCVRNPLHLLGSIGPLGVNVVAVDWTVDIAAAWREVGYSIAIQGNLDPSVLLSDKRSIIEETAKILVSTSSRRGHIFSLGHGVHRETPISALKFLVDFVKRWGA